MLSCDVSGKTGIIGPQQLLYHNIIGLRRDS
jgi:hypothetical protein